MPSAQASRQQSIRLHQCGGHVRALRHCDAFGAGVTRAMGCRTRVVPLPPGSTQPSLDSWIIDSAKARRTYPMCKSGTIIRLDNMKHVAVQTICVVINIMSGRSGTACTPTHFMLDPKRARRAEDAADETKSASKRSRTFGQLPDLTVPNNFDDPLPGAEIATWDGDSPSQACPSRPLHKRHSDEIGQNLTRRR
jgi:hypothetical protein